MKLTEHDYTLTKTILCAIGLVTLCMYYPSLPPAAWFVGMAVNTLGLIFVGVLSMIDCPKTRISKQLIYTSIATCSIGLTRIAFEVLH